MRTKTCSSCGATLPIAQFARQTSSPDGHCYVCTPCRRAAYRAGRANCSHCGISRPAGTLNADGVCRVCLRRGVGGTDVATWLAVCIDKAGGLRAFITRSGIDAARVTECLTGARELTPFEVCAAACAAHDTGVTLSTVREYPRLTNGA